MHLLLFLHILRFEASDIWINSIVINFLCSLIGIWPHKVITLDLIIIFRSHLFQCCDYRKKKIGHKDRAFSLSDFYLKRP